ncbi:MAG: hypothetical protein M1818_006037 [Claussenomyces sp. TS43310]|nr:MAG: hypothetical protein M1818_006037 [Claussenomyces sp. TS43310]
MALFVYMLGGLGCIFLYIVATTIDRFILTRRISKAYGCKPVHKLPQRERIIGYDLFREQRKAAAEKSFLDVLLARVKAHGNTYSQVILGRKMISTVEPENVKTVLATNFQDYCLGHRFPSFSPLLGRGIFTSDGAHWEHSRALVRPNFAKAQVADLDTFETYIQQMIKKIPRDGSTVDLQPLFFQLTLDSATEFLFGESVNVLQSPEGSEQQLFGTAFDYAQSELRTRNRLGAFLPLYRNKRFDEACLRIHNFVDGIVYKALEYRKLQQRNLGNEKGTGKYVFLTELSKETDDPKRLRDESLNLLLAGRDSTAGLLGHTFHALARRPDVWEKLMAEVDTLGGARPDYDTLKSLKYVRNVLYEALRLWPAVPSNARTAIRDTILPRGGGPDRMAPILVTKGQSVTWSVFCMHRRKDLWGPDAEDFRPERWDEKRAIRIGWGYLPFNGGPRICLGQQFSITEASYTVVRLCQQFRAVENRDARPWVEGLGVTLSSLNGAKVAMISR